MNKISYIFFASDDPEAEPISRMEEYGFKTVRKDNFSDAVLWAAGEVTRKRYDVLHIFEDDGENIAPALSVKRYATM